MAFNSNVKKRKDYSLKTKVFTQLCRLIGSKSKSEIGTNRRI